MLMNFRFMVRELDAQLTHLGNLLIASGEEDHLQNLQTLSSNQRLELGLGHQLYR